jgi:hypothetical protein
MRTREFMHRALVAAAIAVVAAIVMSGSALAQVCCTATITNNTNCPITICIRTAAGNQCTQYAANSVQVVNVPCVPFQVWVATCGGHVQIPPGGCVEPVALQGGCCAKVCFGKDANNCYTITADPSNMACPCD